MLVVLPSDLRELKRGRAVTLHMLAARVAEHLGRGGRRLESPQLDHELEMLVHRVGAIGVFRAERALFHLLEAERERAVADPAFDQLLGHEQRRRAGRAVVVHIVNWDTGEPEAVNRALPASRLAIAIADYRLLNLVER